MYHLKRKLRIKQLLFVFCFLFWPLIGCDCGDGTGVGQAPVLEAAPDNLIFSAITLGESETKSFTIKSTGLSEVRISAIKIKVETGGTPYQIVDLDKITFPLILGPGEAKVLKVKYTPEKAGAAEGKVLIECDASNTEVDGAVHVKLLASNVGGWPTATPNPLDFGAVAKGDAKTMEVSLFNGGKAPIELTKHAIANDTSKQFSIASKDAVPETIEAGATLKIKLTYTPTVPEGRAEYVVSIKDGSDLTVRLIGRLSAPALEVEPLKLVFQGVKINSTKTLPVTLKSVGELPVKIESLEFGTGDSPPYTLANAPKLPLEIAPGKEAKIEVAFKPTSTKTYPGSLLIKSNDANKPTIKVVLSGNPQGCNLSATPPELLFGNDGNQDITLANTGTAPCKLDKVSLDASSGKGFSIVKAPKAGTSLTPNGTAVVTVAFKNTSKQPETGKLVVVSGDAAADLEVPLQYKAGSGKPCTIEVSPRTVQFGFVSIGQSKRLAANVTNKGNQPCTLKQAILKDSLGVFALQTSIPSKGVTIAAGQTFAVEVSFTPFSNQAATAKMDLVTDDPATPTTTVTLLGSGGERCLDIQPEPLDVGAVKTGCASANQILTIRNTCQNPLTVSKIEWQASASKEFSVQPAGLPRTLNAGESFTVTVKYRPTDLGPDLAPLDIVHSVTNQSPTTIIVKGEGVDTDERVETFTQSKKAKIDVMFVIDDSQSMDDNQKSLAANLQSFIQWASQLQADFQIAVTTTDVDCGTKYKADSSGICTRPSRPKIPLSGCFRGTPTVLTPQTPNLLQKFADNVKVGLRGSGTEQGIEASYQALTPAKLKTCNSGFLRDDASLSIIYISDEPDGSPNPVAFYVNFFQSLKGFRTELVRASAVVGTASGCTTTTGQRVKAAPDYWDIASKLRGVQASICSTQWANTLSQLGSLTFGLKRDFFLKGPAVPGSIQVKVDGKVVAEGSTGWTYDANAYGISFSSAATPQAGAQIEVRYKALCNP